MKLNKDRKNMSSSDWSSTTFWKPSILNTMLSIYIMANASHFLSTCFQSTIQREKIEPWHLIDSPIPPNPKMPRDRVRFCQPPPRPRTPTPTLTPTPKPKTHLRRPLHPPLPPCSPPPHQNSPLPHTLASLQTSSFRSNLDRAADSPLHSPHPTQSHSKNPHNYINPCHGAKSHSHHHMP